MSRRGKKPKSSSDDGWGQWGGYMAAKRQKLQDQFNQDKPGELRKEGSGSTIFSGISIYVNGYTKPSSDELKRLMMLHGGNYETYLYRTRVTHVIATNLPYSKIKELKGLKVVRPEWITESIAAGKLLSYAKYLLYTAQTGGIQKGLQSFTSVVETSNQSMEQTQSRNSSENVEKRNFEINESSSENLMDDEILNRSDEKDKSFLGIHDSSVMNSNCAQNDIRDTIPGVSNQSIRKELNSSVSPAKAGDPKFLNEFYNNSRLHYLSTWKAEWKNYVNELQSKGNNFPGREKLKQIVLQREVIQDAVSEREVTVDDIFTNPSKKCIMHIDMDCFFVSVGLRKRPDLRGKPVAVTHSRGKGAKPDPNSDLIYERRQRELKVLQGGRKGPGKKKAANQNGFPQVSTSFPDFPDDDDDNGDDDDDCNNVSSTSKTTTESFHSMAEIASCSYEARKAGLRNGMFMGQAKSICPELVTISYDFDGYKEVSKILYDTVASYTHDIEAVSCDEMLIDCTDLLRNTGATPLEFSTLLRSEIYNMTGCTASAGIGSSILLARMATRKAKPNGQFYLTGDLVSEYIRNQPVRDLPGVGWSLTKRFEAMNVRTCGDLQTVSLEVLQKEFGPKTGQSMYKYCRGQDDRPIKIEQQRKSVSAEVNYGIRFSTDHDAAKFMEELSEEVCSRLKNIKMKGKTITLKLMVRRKDAPKETSKFMGHGICNNFSKSVSLPLATDESRIVAKETIGLLRQHKAEPADLRGIGIQMQKLEPAEVGITGTSKKLPSILDYTVNRKLVHDENKGDNSRASKCDKTIENMKQVTLGTKNSEKLKNCNSKLRTSVKTLFQAENEHVGNDLRRGTDDQKCDRKTENEILRNDLGRIDDVNGDSYDENEFMENMDFETRNDTVCSTDVVESIEHKTGSNTDTVSRCEDFVEELGRRFDTMSELPPLPSFPEIKTPESVKKSVRFNTPEVVEQTSDDYFPSPSQVDPEVLKELPSDIRKQIEQEMKNRRKKKATSNSVVITSQPSNEPSCSHWQQNKSNNSNQLNKGGNSHQAKKESNSCQSNRGDYSNVGTENKGDNKQDEAIVALPSPSQIDPSCLEALPESLQAELRQAYAKQDSERRANIRGGNTLQLKQAKSPSKSPGKNKRSPGKHSPNFKVPRGRPSARGKKKASLKKILFKDQTNKPPLQVEKSNTSKPSHNPQVSSAQENSNMNEDIIIDLCTNSETNINARTASADKSINRSLHPTTQREVTQNTHSTRERTQHEVQTSSEREIIQYQPHCDNNSTDDLDLRNSVSLCGAVKLKDVKLLIREWISSTPYPQQEDEEVLINYLESLVLDKNLEQVDLIFKFMLRSINMLNSADWLFSLKRIYTSIQTVVYNMYGSRLVSITL